MNEKVKKIFKIAGDVLLYIFIGICLVAVIVTITGKRSEDGTVSLFGMQMRLVLTESMEKSEYTNLSGYKIKDIPKDSMIFIKEVPEDEKAAEEFYSKLRVGDVLTFRYVYTRQETITHRITAIKKNDDGIGYTIELEGDNKSTQDGAMVQTIDTSGRINPTNYVIGKVTGSSFLLGLLLTIIKSPLGLIFIIIIPSVVIIVMEVVKIVKMMTAEKREKEQQEKDAQQSELDMLKKRLAELEGQKASATAESEDKSEGDATEESAPDDEN